MPKGVYKHHPLSEECKEKIRKKMMGNIYGFRKGSPSWNKGKKMSEEYCRNNRDSHKGKHFWNKGQFQKGHVPMFKGKSLPYEMRVKISMSVNKTKEFNGFILPEHERIRKSASYQNWRNAVFKRDDYTCQISGKRGGNLVAHHIHEFSKNPEIRLQLDNGYTLDKKLHIRFHKEYGKSNNNMEQLIEFKEKVLKE